MGTMHGASGRSSHLVKYPSPPSFNLLAGAFVAGLLYRLWMKREITNSFLIQRIIADESLDRSGWAKICLARRLAGQCVL
jgi:hypothetical protein